MKKFKSMSVFPPPLVVLCSVIMQTACPTFAEMPTYPVEVIGFASSCGQEASVKIAKDTHPERQMHEVYSIESIGEKEQERVEVLVDQVGRRDPLTVKVGLWICAFAESYASVQETACTPIGSTGQKDTCWARLNYMGTRAPTLPPFSEDSWRAHEEGTWNPTSPDALFNEPDFEELKQREEEEQDRLRKRQIEAKRQE